VGSMTEICRCGEVRSSRSMVLRSRKHEVQMIGGDDKKIEDD